MKREVFLFVAELHLKQTQIYLIAKITYVIVKDESNIILSKILPIRFRIIIIGITKNFGSLKESPQTIN